MFKIELGINVGLCNFPSPTFVTNEYLLENNSVYKIL